MRRYRRKRKTAPRVIVLCAVLLLVVLPAAFGLISATAVHDPVPPESLEVTGSPAPAPSESLEVTGSPAPAPTESSGIAGTAAPVPSNSPEVTDAPGPTGEATLEPSAGPTQAPEYPPYSFGACLEESEPAADDSVFDNAVFLGDSRTEGLQMYSGLTHGDFFWKRGMTVFRVDSEKWTFAVDGEELTMIEALGKKRYDSVYIMIGVNELGYPVSSYEQNLGIFIDKVIAAQPDAVIYLQLLPPVNDQAARDSNLGSYINNGNVNAFNGAIIRVAAEKRVVLLDTAEVFRGADGQLPADMTLDGCHFKPGKYSLWADYLRCHIIDPVRYRYCREAPGAAGSIA